MVLCITAVLGPYDTLSQIKMVNKGLGPDISNINVHYEIGVNITLSREMG